jgi:hypothetical protein
MERPRYSATAMRIAVQRASMLRMALSPDMLNHHDQVARSRYHNPVSRSVYTYGGLTGRRVSEAHFWTV